MNKHSIAGIWLVFALGACGNGSDPNTPGTAGAPGVSGGTGGAPSAGTGGVNLSAGTSAGGSSAGSPSGGQPGGGQPGGGGAGSPGTSGAGTNGGSAGGPGGAPAVGGGGQSAVAGGGGASGASPEGGAAGAPPSNTGPVTVQLTQEKQEIYGFGINDALQPDNMSFSATILDNLFTTNGPDAIGLNILRIGMSPNGGLRGSKTSNINGAKARGAKIIGSVWSPPGDWKKGQTPLDSQNPTYNGGHILPENYDKWATRIVDFAKQYGVEAMSIGNEPDFASCGTNEPCNGNYETTLFTANEMVAWVKVAGKKLQEAGIKSIAPEASEWLHLWSNESATGSEPSGKNSSDPMKCGFPPSNPACEKGDGYDYGHWLAKDADAWKALDIIGIHQYDTHRAEPWPADVTGGKRDKPIWQTEMSGVKWWPEQGPSCDIKNGIAVAGWIHSALTVGEASAWLWWWYDSYYTDNNEGLMLKSGSSAGSKGCDISKPTKRYYTLGNYSKFVRPDYKRVDITGAIPGQDLLLSAYKGADGTVVVVAINKGTTEVPVPITIAGGTAPAMVTPWVTSATDNLVSKTAVPVTGGTFTATLAAQSVTTFVGK